MGVHGLTTYFRENQRTLSTVLVLEDSSSSRSPPVALVVDGWSFIYTLYQQSRLPWVYGGEYTAFHALVVDVVQAWIRVGFRPYFVFDGPYPPSKFTTVTNRITQETINSALLFFRTSPVSRASPRFLREISMLPPLCYSVCLQALRSPQFQDTVQVYIADEEGDPYTVELAGRVKGFVTGNDSDYLILNAEGYAGYIPMAEMVWTGMQTPEENGDDDDDGFTVVGSSKSGSRANADSQQSEWGLLVPEATAGLSLTCTVYKPADLAEHFKLPISLLPLLGALVGNDFVADRRSMHDLLFERGLTLSQRITRVAQTLRANLAASMSGAPKRKPKQQINGVTDLIGVTIDSLAARPLSTIASGERDVMIEKIVEATLHYAIPKHDGQSALGPTEVCALHSPDACLIPNLLNPSQSSDLGLDTEDDETRQRIRALYVNAYRRGRLHPRHLDAFSTATSWCSPFLEDPDLEPVAKSIGRPLREWIYAILDDGIGLPESEDNKDESEASNVHEAEDGDDGDDDGDELIDVVEEDSDDEGDPLAPLRGALQELHGDGTETDASVSGASHTLSSTRARPKTLFEYIRRGTRLAPEEVAVPTLASLYTSIGMPHDAARHVPIQLQPESERLALFLRILGSDTPAIASLPPPQLAAALALRWVLRRLHARASGSGFNRDRDRERWTQHEARAFLASFVWAPGATGAPEPDAPPLENRNVQLVAQVSEALKVVGLLAEVLLLTERVPSPAYLFSGKRFHYFLTTGKSEDLGAVDALYSACFEGMEDAFGQVRGKKGKKERKAKGQQSTPSRSTAPNGASRSLFGMLVDMEED